MQIKIGDKIRELRRRDGRKQEDLANALGVTNQAVSRWEANGGYPDLEMIPAIANYFHVSIDELFGYHGDREEKIKEILAQADHDIKAQGNLLAAGHGDITECVQMLRAASAEFPSEPEIFLKLGEALHMLGYQKYGARACFKEETDYIYEDTAYHSRNTYWQEALGIYEKLLEMDISAEQRGRAVFSMSALLKRMGKSEKAKTLVNQQGSILYCREILLQRAAEGEEMDRYRGEAIIALLQELYHSITGAVVLKKSLHTAEYGRYALLALAELYEAIFCDGNCGSQHGNICQLYLYLADYEAKYSGDLQKALAYFDKGYEHHEAHCSICNTDEYMYTAPLVSKAVTPGQKIPPVSGDFWKLMLEGMSAELCSELRKNEKYAACFA